MPSRTKKLDRTVASLPSIPKELVAQFLSGPMTGEAINAAGIAFKQALIQASLNAELTHHLGYAPGAERPEATTNQRNGVTEVSPDLISTVTDGVLAEVTAWQARPLEAAYPVVFFGALRGKVREDHVGL